MTELQKLQVLLAWEAGELSEGQAAKTLGVPRIVAREMRHEAIEAGVQIAMEKRACRPAQPHVLNGGW